MDDSGKASETDGLPIANCAPGETARADTRQAMNNLPAGSHSPIASDGTLQARREQAEEASGDGKAGTVGETSPDPARRARADASRPLGGD